MPADVKRIVAIRPALILQTPGVRNRPFSGMSVLDPHVGRLVLYLPRTLKSIDQVVFGYGKTPEGAKAGALEEPDCMMIRSIEEFDWKRFVQRDLGFRYDSASPPIELEIKGKTYYKSTAKRSWITGQGECYLFPDARTIIVGREEALLHVIGRGRATRPDLAKGDDWRTVETCPIALVVNKLAWERPLGHYELMTSLLLPPTCEIEHVERVTCGIDHLEAMRLHAIVTLPNAEESRRSALTLLAEQWTAALSVSALRIMSALGVVDMKDDPDLTQPDDSPEGILENRLIKFENRLFEEMARMSQVRLEGRTIHLTKRTRISFKDLIPEGF